MKRFDESAMDKGAKKKAEEGRSKMGRERMKKVLHRDPPCSIRIHHLSLVPETFPTVATRVGSSGTPRTSGKRSVKPSSFGGTDNFDSTDLFV